jgi:hypothetical protein
LENLSPKEAVCGVSWQLKTMLNSTASNYLRSTMEYYLGDVPEAQDFAHVYGGDVHVVHLFMD